VCISWTFTVISIERASNTHIHPFSRNCESVYWSTTVSHNMAEAKASSNTATVLGDSLDAKMFIHTYKYVELVDVGQQQTNKTKKKHLKKDMRMPQCLCVTIEDFHRLHILFFSVKYSHPLKSITPPLASTHTHT